MIYEKEVNELIEISNLDILLSGKELDDLKIVLDNQIITGVNNGYTVESQLILVKALIKKNNEN